MSQTSKVLMKNPVLEPALDFYRLRREGIGFIEQMGSKLWTDYNVHDPGITILEAVGYAITDLGYRIGWAIEDILSPAVAPFDSTQPYPDQAFFTARNILTINPATSEDFRRLLIDLDKVRNAWILCKQCACDVTYFAWCENEKLVLSYRPAPVVPAPVAVWQRGLYEALLELESDPELGDLNDRKVDDKVVFHDAGGVHPTIVELRFPDISLTHQEQWQLFLDDDAGFASANDFQLKLTGFGAARSFNLFTDIATDAERDAYIRKHWRGIFYASFELEIVSSGKKLAFPDATLRLLSATNATPLREVLEDRGASGVLQRYRRKAKLAAAALKSAKKLLHKHRNLNEDYCVVKTVGVEEVAVCADVEVQPDADIERVQAHIWFELEQYFSPPIRFRTLQEMLDAGGRTEVIFEGPELDSGFIDGADLEASALKSVLRVSDILNRLMDIPGVIAVRQLLLTKYDSKGNPIKGAADPTWVNGNPVFDANRLSASWLLFMNRGHQPRLYANLSRFLFFKNGLPFLPRMDEAKATLNRLLGDADRPKNPSADKDLKIPKGNFRNPEDYYPVQYSLPETYGIGVSGLPSNASALRRGQAKQLKAYLMIFEQMLANALAQLAHTADLFSLDPTIRRTTFVKLLNETLIQGFDAIARSGMTQTAIETMVETQLEFYERRNRFLNHLLARFGEDFSEYALLLTDAAGNQVAQQRLIENKVAFLKRYPKISHDRARAFDYTHDVCVEANYPGIKKRIMLLLGLPDLSFAWTVGTPVGGEFPLDLKLNDSNGRTWFEGALKVPATNEATAKQTGYRIVLKQMVRADAYDNSPKNGKFPLKLKNKTGGILGQLPQPADSAAAAVDLRDQLMAWSANERLIVVEHLLLRPRFLGDALYPCCCDGGCHTCGEEDPYSFRLTFVMPGWVAQYTDNLDFRRFADQTIQMETPSHLLGKTCWVGNDGFIENPCDELVGRLGDLLIAKSTTAGGASPSPDDACACASAIYHAFSSIFNDWYQDKTLDFLHADALSTLILGEFQKHLKPSDVTCTTVLIAPLWTEVQTMMTNHFVETALNGWQFERFETAWCRWLEANAEIDWTEERLAARVKAILDVNLLTAQVRNADLCDCATGILRDYGTLFFAWMQSNLKAGTAFDKFTDFVPPSIVLCAGMSFQAGTADAIAQLLSDRYNSYRKVSYRLWVVVSLLCKLRNTYPGATLHDCDDGSDQNPVRLDNTGLGNYPLRNTLT